MRHFYLFFFLFVNFFSLAQSTDKPKPISPAKDILSKMLVSMEGVKTCSFVLDMQERIKGKFRKNEYIVKLNVNPYKTYVYSVGTNPGAEVLLIKGENSNKAIINPNRLIIPTLSLDPHHSILRKNHQYTLWEFGFTYILNVLNAYMHKHQNNFYSYLHLDADINFKGNSYYQLVIEKNDFAWVPYQVKKGETLTSISNMLLVNDYMILENNPEVKGFDNIHEDQIIKVPNAFGKKIIFYVDKYTFLPMVQIVYDDKGLYGRVEITSFILNPKFTSEDFSKDNKNYNF